jgi:hypothetical protein
MLRCPRRPDTILTLALARVSPTFAPVAAAFFIAFPSTVSGQPPAMGGVVRHIPDGRPIECLHVALADSLDRTVVHTVTDSLGMFVLVAPDTGSYRVEFEIPGTEPLTGPLSRLAAGEVNEQEYPLSFDRRISGELALLGSKTRRKVVDLGDWHSVVGEAHPGARVTSEGEFVRAAAMAVEVKRLAAQFIVDSTGRPRADSWRAIASSDPNTETRGRTELLARHYLPARLGEQPVCQLVMTEMKYFRTGRANRPLQ